MPMKVTVCFDKVKVLVPCGDGELLVRELIEKAIIRYKKAIGKPTDYWVSVHSLRTASEDSILDPDDTLIDVVDDREQLLADFEEQGGPALHHNGDGQSVSSAGTTSPDIFQNELTNHKHHHRGFSFDSAHDVVVTATDISSGSGLTVRRGSEPTLNVLDTNGDDSTTHNGPLSPLSPDLDENLNQRKQDDNSFNKDGNHKPVIKGMPPAKEKTPPFSRFARDSWRQSLGNQPNMFKWFEAQEKQEEKHKVQTERQGPIGGAASPEQEHEGQEKAHKPRILPPVPPAKQREVGVLICLKNDGSPLGIHVVPNFDEDGRAAGLEVQSIENGGKIDKDGRLKVQDRIIDINSHDLHGVSFAKAQEIFRNSMKTDEIQLKVIKHSLSQAKKPPPPTVLPKPRGHSPIKPSPLTLTQTPGDINTSLSSPEHTSTPLDTPEHLKKVKSNSDSLSQSQSSNSDHTDNQRPLVKTPSVEKRAPPLPPARHPSTTLSSSSTSTTVPGVSDNSSDIKTDADKGNDSSKGSDSTTPLTGTLTKNKEAIIAPTNTKKLGKRVEIELVKGQTGLGFSVTTRDNPTGGPSPIYIKNILPKGAAISDGRLRAGDRLLEVNGQEMTGKTQSEAVAVLRNTLPGSTVEIVVSRQEIDADGEEGEEEPQDERFKVPRELPFDKSGDDGTLAIMKNKELIEFDIPLNDSGSAGLGVSVKGKTLTMEDGLTRDLGIFVKSVIHGGAASKDGRLLVNDQLLEVNETSLIDYSNTEAMELLRNAMQTEGPVPGCINIKVARRIGAPSPSPFASPGSNENELGDIGSGFSKEIEENNNSLDKSDHVTHIRASSLDRSEDHNKLNMSDFKSPNLFLDRIKAGNGLRNMSYTRATRESYMETPEPRRTRDNLIDLSKQKPRPHSTIGIGKRSPSGSASSSSEDLNKEPAWLQGPDWTRHASQTSEESELSPTGDGFSRDGFGRQSMSEKRKGHGDPRSSETYQKAKGLKDLHKGFQKSIQQSGSYGRLVRAGSADSLLSRSSSSIQMPRSGHAMRGVHDKFAISGIRGPAPPTNLKRFSSLENLSKMHDNDSNNASFDDEDLGSQQPRMVRRRGGNESFRAAVDRSYDPVPHLDMETQQEDGGDKDVRMRRTRSVEEEGSEGGSTGHDPTNSARSSVSDNVFADDKKKGGKKGKEARRSGGLLKGFFNFRKGRKTPVDDIGKADIKKDSGDHRDHVDHGAGLWKQAEVDQERSQEQYRRLQEQQMLDQQRQRLQNHHQQQQLQPSQPFNPFPYKPPEPHNMGHSAPVISNRDMNKDVPLSRAEKIQQLRADHQRRHQERQGLYPSEDREEEYERQIQEEERKITTRFTTDEYFLQKFGQSAIPSQIEVGGGQRSQGPVRSQMERPNSRGAVVDPMTGSNNYRDYQDMQYFGNRHVSDSNITPSNYTRPPSRGQVYPEQHFYPNQTQYPPSQPHILPRGPTPSRDLQMHSGTPRGQTPSFDTDRGGNAQVNFGNSSSNYANYHQVHRGPTPSRDVNRGSTPSRDLYIADKRHYSEDSAFRATDINNGKVVNNLSHNRDHVTRPDNRPPGGGNFGNSSQAYRDPVYIAMAGKRPVKSLSTQPNSAKV